MLRLISNLRPRLTNPGDILVHENEEVNEIVFISCGRVDVGYSLNRTVKYVIRFHNRTMVGAYNTTFKKRSIGTYKSHTQCHGYSINSWNWQ